MSAPKGPKDPAQIYIGDKIRQRRLELGWTQERLGQEIGISFQQVQKYEKGTNAIAHTRMLRMAKAMGVSVMWFSSEAPGFTDMPIEMPEPTRLTAQDMRARKLWRGKINSGQKEIIIRLMEEMQSSQRSSDSDIHTP